MTARIGIDCGSSACKAVLATDGGIAAFGVKPTGWNSRETAASLVDELLAEGKLRREEVTIVATGYGRVGMDFADRAVTEITCHALGAEHLLPGVRTVVDIGGQDSKIISVGGGKVLSFQMNDKCAAGTGRFLEMSASRMGVSVSDFDGLLKTGRSCPLSSMCAVFADSEIVSLLAAGKSREEVAGGIVNSIVSRVSALAAKNGIQSPVLLTGGLSGLAGLRRCLEENLGCPVASNENSRYAGAIGAALIAP